MSTYLGQDTPMTVQSLLTEGADTIPQPSNPVRDFLMQPYGAADLTADMTKMQPRFVDTWVIPPLMIWLGLSQGGMGRWPRRMLFSAGAYMLMRNYSNYKTAVMALSAMARQGSPTVAQSKGGQS